MTHKICSVAGLWAAIVCVATSATADSAVPDLGAYQGNLIEASASGALQKFAVGAHLTRPGRGMIHLDIQGNPSLNSTLDLSLDKHGRNLTLNIPGTAIQNQLLTEEAGCFSVQTPLSISLCIQKDTIAVTAQDAAKHPVYFLQLEYFGNVAGDIHLESPQTFTLDAAVSRAMTKDFSTQIEFQHMLQARLTARAAYLDLMPHLSNSSILGLSSGPLAVLGVLGMAGDLVPFLFPSRWLQALESRRLSDAESDALALMRGDAGLNVEILAYAIDHDTQELAFLQTDFRDAVVIRRKTLALEARNLVPAGTSAHLESVLASLHDAMDDLAYPLQAEYAALSQAMGFVNPLAVTAVQITDVPPTLLNGQEVLNIADFQDLVLSRSIELRQMDHLVAAAKIAKKADIFSWLDPSADISQSLGVGLGTTIAIDRSQVVALQIQKSQTASTVLQNLADTIIQYNHSIDDIGDSASGMALEADRKAKLMTALDSGNPVSDTEITSIPFDQLTWQINSLDAKLDYRSSMAKIERMLLQGYYANLNGNLTPPTRP